MTTNSVNPKMLEVLKRAWKDVEKDYENGKLNSEYCLQAALYCALRKILDPDPAVYTILVNPPFNGEEKSKPDLIIRDEISVYCVIELKMTPHFFVPAAKFDKDIRNLVDYSKHENEKVRLDIFGPKYYFDVKTKKSTPKMPTYVVSPQALYVFGVLTRCDDKRCEAKNVKSLLEHLAGKGKFSLLSGITHPNDKKTGWGPSEFKVEVL